MNLVSLTELIPDAVIDLRYAGRHNVAKRPISDETVPRLDGPAAEALQQVATEFRQQDLRLLIWDAYRTERTQATLRRIANDDRYALERSNHCRGLAIDISLARANGTALDMGTDHDEFSELADSNAIGLSAEQMANRYVLRAVMERFGFAQWPHEWWHFDFIEEDAL